MELYVHIPFCVRKCRYCSFTSYAAKENDYAEYIALLLKEAEKRAAEIAEPLHTVYIGGGTPSLLPPELLKRLLDGLKKIFGFDQVTEFTSEANPGTINDKWLQSAVSCGINRLSIGMQAYQDDLLKVLGRIHRYDDVRSSVISARHAGICNINLDLIFGLPGQKLRDWRETLDAALDLAPDHISAYGLIPEEGTPIWDDLHSGRLNLPESEEEREMYELAVSKLGAYGFRQYEISNFARPGYECLHNIGYWTQIPYTGLGLSAASMYNIQIRREGMTYSRRANPSGLDQYIEMICSGRIYAGSEEISEAEARFETMMLGLRMNEGVSEDSFYRMHGISLDSCYGIKLSFFEKNGLMYHENGRWKLTPRGFDIQNSILVELMDA